MPDNKYVIIKIKAKMPTDRWHRVAEYIHAQANTGGIVVLPEYCEVVQMQGDKIIIKEEETNELS